MRNCSLIITSKDDAHADYVINKAATTGCGDRFIRLNTEDFLTNCAGTFGTDGFSIYLRDSGRTIESGSIYSVWYRRPQELQRSIDEDEVWRFVSTQASAFMRGLYFCLHDHARWVNPLPSLHRARFKLQQLELAKRMGMTVPDTLVTNVHADALSFVRSRGQVCTKSLDEPNFRLDGTLYPMFTRLVDDVEVEQAVRAIELCPTLFQEYVDKAVDLRVVVVGEDVFAVEISSQDHPLSTVDFRGAAPRLIDHRVHRLPDALRAKVIEFVRAQGLLYSALDFALDKRGRYFFLENNPNGQWLWLELRTGLRISDAMLRELLPPSTLPHAGVEGAALAVPVS